MLKLNKPYINSLYPIKDTKIMKRLIILFLLISFSVNSQDLTKEILFGEWKVENVVSQPNIPKINPLIDGFRNSTFTFDKTGKFDLKTTKDSELFSMTAEMTKNTYWNLEKSSNLIRIGTPKDNYSIMGIHIKIKDDLTYFELQESGIILKMIKTKTDVNVNFTEQKVLDNSYPDKPIENNPNTVIEINESEVIPFELVENIPITSDCKSNLNKEKLRECVQKSITMHVNRKFNADLASTLGLAPKIHKIITTFIIDKNGDIINVHSEGSDPVLNNEAERVISILPKMKPGIKDEKAINVKYTLPIQFKVE